MSFGSFAMTKRERRNNRVSLLSFAADDGGKPDDLGASPDDNQQFEFAIVCKMNIRVIQFDLFHYLVIYSTGSK